MRVDIPYMDRMGNKPWNKDPVIFTNQDFMEFHESCQGFVKRCSGDVFAQHLAAWYLGLGTGSSILSDVPLK